MDIKEVFDKFLFNINTTNNGEISIFNFNIISKSAEIRLIEWLTGGLSGLNMPSHFVSQRSRDLLSPFLEKAQSQVVDGKFKRPKDYYTKDVFYAVGDPNRDTISCDGENEISGADTEIDIVDAEEFMSRKNSFIPGLQKSTFAKLMRDEFVISKKKIGTCVLEYIRFPKYGNVVPKIDNVLNIEVVDTALSTDYEWDDSAMELLVWFLVDSFTDWNSNRSQKENNMVKKKEVMS